MWEKALFLTCLKWSHYSALGQCRIIAHVVEEWIVSTHVRTYNVWTGAQTGSTQEEVVMMILVYLVVGFDEVLTAPSHDFFGQRTNWNHNYESWLPSYHVYSSVVCVATITTKYFDICKWDCFIGQAVCNTHFIVWILMPLHDWSERQRLASCPYKNKADRNRNVKNTTLFSQPYECMMGLHEMRIIANISDTLSSVTEISRPVRLVVCWQQNGVTQQLS